MSRKSDTKAVFKVGDWVTFPYGTMNVHARIIEDRGRIGHKGRRLYRIEIPFVDGEPSRFEMPEEDMTATTVPKTIGKHS
jgi:hypothetical protein